jgi:hypothetical protein
VWNPDVADPHDYAGDWLEVPANSEFENGFKTQWEEFIRHVVEDTPNPYDLLSGDRGDRLAEAGLESARTGTRVDLPTPPRTPRATGAAPVTGCSSRDWGSPHIPERPAPTFFGAYGQWIQTPAPTWDDVRWLREQWDGPFLLDGGIRRGSDVVKALALGARAAPTSGASPRVDRQESTTS